MLGQYFTTNKMLQSVVREFILNKPDLILEPSIGRGDLVFTDFAYDMYEIDESIKLLNHINRDKVIYGDFIAQTITKQYATIIGNPPYVKKAKNANLYIKFVEKCYLALKENGELIFIVPSDFFKLTSASSILNTMFENGNFTHVFHPNDEKLFENATIDIIIFRYCKNKSIPKKTLYNSENLHAINENGFITFSKEEPNESQLFQHYFDIYVGMVSAKESIFKNDALGNIDVLNENGPTNKYIFVDSFPCDNEAINTYLLSHKKDLIARRIKKFNQTNWFEWGAPRNIKIMRENANDECIYIHTLTRKNQVAFVGRVQYFGGGLLMLLPKKSCNLDKVVEYLNGDNFKSNFTFAKRFKLGHRQLSLSRIPLLYL